MVIMSSDIINKVLTELVKTKPEELSIARLQLILQSINETLADLECNENDPLWNVSVKFLCILQRFLAVCLMQSCRSGNGHVPQNEFINPAAQQLFYNAVDRIRQFTINLYLPKELRSLSKRELTMVVKLEQEEQLKRLKYCLEAFRNLFEFKIVAVQAKLEHCILEYIAGVFSYYFLVGGSNNFKDDPLYKSLELFPIAQIFKSLLIIKGVPNLPLELAKQLHLELLRLTGDPGGYPVLCRSLLANVPSDETPLWKKSEIIAKIVASKGHTKKFYRQVVHDIFTFYETSLFSKDEDKQYFYSTCIECMKQMYLLPPAYHELRQTIDEYFVGRFDQLEKPNDLLSGTIILDRDQLITALYINYMAFSGSSCTSLSSSILVPYLNIFLKLYSMLPTTASDEKNYLQTLIVFCLSNREKAELESIIKELLLKNENPVYVSKELHPRIYRKTSNDTESYTLQIGPANENEEEENLAPELIEILKMSNRNILIYDVFIVLLKLFEQISSAPNEKLLLDFDEQDASKCKTFYRKYVMIQALLELISHKQFHNQLYENPADILAFIKSLLIKNMENASANENLLEVVLSIFQEYLKRLQTREDVQEIFKLLNQLKQSSHCSDQQKIQIEQICDGNKLKNDYELTPYQNAVSLCSDKEPYCKVYGTTLMIRLLRERDTETLTQKHAILILAMRNLKNVESYAFLNSVRLLVALCDVLEADTIDALIHEYQCVDNEVDFRLKVGEATMKTVEAVGPIAFKYREQLINCFLHECKSPIDEFRSSSLANLGNVCKILSYQVHNFFFEMFMVIKSAIETDCYLPVRRAAILVLSQLIEGIDNLLDFQDYLLVIYRFLKFINETETDEVTRLQATVALDHLKAKTKDFLTAANTALSSGRLEKEIRIFGIKDQEAESSQRNVRGSGSILTKMLD